MVKREKRSDRGGDLGSTGSAVEGGCLGPVPDVSRLPIQLSGLQGPGVKAFHTPLFSCCAPPTESTEVFWAIHPLKEHET